MSALLVGCGETDPAGTVQGKATLDGAPFTDGAVVFIDSDSGQAATADIQSDGTFSIESPLPAGSYVVFIVPKSTGLEEGMNEPMKEKSLHASLPAKYLNRASSDIKVEVKEGINEGVKVELKSK